MAESETVIDAKTLLEQSGYVVIKARTYRGLQERVRIAEQATAFERETNQTTHAWARRAFDEQDRLSARLNFVYGEARAAGCTIEQLTTPAQAPTTKETEQ